MTRDFSQDFGPFEGKIWLNCSHQGALPQVAVLAALGSRLNSQIGTALAMSRCIKATRLTEHSTSKTAQPQGPSIREMAHT